MGRQAVCAIEGTLVQLPHIAGPERSLGISTGPSVPSWRVPPLIGVPPQFARLRAANTLPGPHGLWIAAAALQLEIPLVTRNTAQFARIEGIQLESY